MISIKTVDINENSFNLIKNTIAPAGKLYFLHIYDFEIRRWFV